MVRRVQNKCEADASVSLKSWSLLENSKDFPVAVIDALSVILFHTFGQCRDGLSLERKVSTASITASGVFVDQLQPSV